MPIEIVIIVAGLVILSYTLLGGLRAVTITNVVQFTILLVITVLVVPISLHAIGGFGNFIDNLPSLKFDHVYKGMKYDIHYLIAVTIINFMVSNWGAAQRYYSVKDERDAKRVGLTCSLLFLTVPLLFGIPPLVARMLWPNLAAVPFFQGDVVPEDLIYVGMVLKLVPNGLIGFFLAAMFAATMSALDATYNIDSSIISKDLYGKLINPGASDERLLKVGKIATVFLGVVTIITGLIYANSRMGIFNLMVIVSALFSIPVSVPMAFGLVFKHMPRWSAVSAITYGLLASIAAKFLLGWSVGPQVYASIIASLVVCCWQNLLAESIAATVG
jgi:Na+/proline symporter